MSKEVCGFVLHTFFILVIISASNAKRLSFVVLAYLLQSQVAAHFEFFHNFAQDRLHHDKDCK